MHIVPWTALVGVAVCCNALAARAVDLADVVEKVEPSVVRIDTKRGLGSGVIIDAKGRVVTNYHVIDGAHEAKVKFRNGRVSQVAGFVAIDPTHDLAILQVDKVSAKLVPIPIADKRPRKGEQVAAFGNPKGMSFSTSEGIVNAIRSGSEMSRLIGAKNYQTLGYATSATWIQTTAAISGGNSGGPLTDMQGNLLGLNTWSTVDAQNLNFAIGAADIKRLIDSTVDEPVQPLSKLPRRAEFSAQGRFTLEMPSGRAFTFDAFMSPMLTAEIDGTHENFVSVPYANGRPRLLGEYRDGTLHGALIVFSEARKPILHAHYSNGQHQGVLRAWNRDGDPAVFMQFSKGKPHGFAVVFGDANLWMIVEYEHDAIRCLQVMDELTPRRSFESAAEAEKDDQAGALLNRMAESLAEIKATESSAKKELAAANKAQRKAAKSATPGD